MTRGSLSLAPVALVVLRTVGIVLAGTIFSGCYARGPAFAPKTLAVGKAIAYVYRPCTPPDGAASGRTETIWINGSNAGPLRCEGYLAQELDPGQVHIEAGQPPSGAQIATSIVGFTLICPVCGVIFAPFLIKDAHNWGGHDVSITAETGQSYFIKYTLKKGWMAPLPQLTLMPPEGGGAEIRDCPSGSMQSCRYSQ